MEKNKKEQLIKTICASLPYDLYAQVYGENVKIIGFSNNGGQYVQVADRDNFPFEVLVENVKPYLRKYDSITEDEKRQMFKDCYAVSLDFERRTTDMVAVPNAIKVTDYLLKNKFDVYGLIEDKIAIEVVKNEKNY